MIHILSALVLSVAGLLAAGSASAADTPPQLVESVPGRYVVVPGDTLWDISAKFLKEPWRWPEIWRMNRAEIKNPHRIYPGDVIVLERDANGQPYLRLETKLKPEIQSEPLSSAIPAIPPNVVEPFIASPLFVEQNTLQTAPRIVATQLDRVFLGQGDAAYVEGADPNQKQWQVFRNGQALNDPEFPDRILGYEAFDLGSAIQMTPGNPAVFEITTAKREIGYGDRLVPASRPRLVDYVPHAPDRSIDGRVVSVYGGVGTGGRLSIISINRGSADGLEVGHVLALEHNRVVTHRDDEGPQKSVTIPPERFGLIFVFRIFEHVSYALIVQSYGPTEVNDFVRTP